MSLYDRSTLTLVIGNKKYSSWSMRPYLVMKTLQVKFREERVSLYVGETSEEQTKLVGFSPDSKKVPVLLVGTASDPSLRIWDSMAICEYVAELDPRAWPEAPATRAVARAVCAEMHSGFLALRYEMPMNCSRSRELAFVPSIKASQDISRISAIWESCRNTYGMGGPWLFGKFSIADAFYAPVAIRFAGYGIKINSETARAYFNHLMADQHVAQWIQDGRAEAEVIVDFE